MRSDGWSFITRTRLTSNKSRTCSYPKIEMYGMRKAKALSCTAAECCLRAQAARKPEEENRSRRRPAAAAAASSFGEAWGLPLGRLALRQERHTSRDPVDRDEAVACVARLLGWYLAGGGGGGAAHFFMVQGCRLRKVLRGGAGRTLYAARRRSLRGKKPLRRRRNRRRSLRKHGARRCLAVAGAACRGGSSC